MSIFYPEVIPPLKALELFSRLKKYFTLPAPPSVQHQHFSILVITLKNISFVSAPHARCIFLFFTAVPASSSLFVYLATDNQFFWLPKWLSGKEPACQFRRCRRFGLRSRISKIPWRRNGNPLQHSCLENSMDRRPWPTADTTGVHGVITSWTRLSMHVNTTSLLKQLIQAPAVVTAISTLDSILSVICLISEELLKSMSHLRIMIWKRVPTLRMFQHKEFFLW